MRNLSKTNFMLFLLILIILMSSCAKKTQLEKQIPVDDVKVEENLENENKKTENEDELDEDVKAANDVINLYIAAAKKLDFDSMNKFITDNKELPILESYKQAYAPYSISDARIAELCKARLGTYKFTIGDLAKNGDDIIATISISMVNMESLQNKWMETLCNKYPEYTTLADDEMTSEVVDVLIQTMIDVLKDSTPTVDVKKEFKLTKNGDSWIINGKNEDFFPSN